MIIAISSCSHNHPKIASPLKPKITPCILGESGIICPDRIYKFVEVKNHICYSPIDDETNLIYQTNLEKLIDLHNASNP